MDRGQLTGALFVDLKKAFDTVNHSALISKLPLYGIEHAEQKWIQNYLTQRSQIACFEGKLSIEEIWNPPRLNTRSFAVSNSHQRCPFIYRKLKNYNVCR